MPKPRSPIPASSHADLVVLNATIRTLDASQPRAEALAASQGRIVALGRSADVRRLAGRRTTVIEARGRLVMPGFNDAHVHFMTGGFSLSRLDARDTREPQEFARRVGEFARRLPRGRWILGGDWDHERWPGQTPPTRDLLDAVAPDHPVFLHRLDGHMAVANSRALALARVSRRTREVPGGVIVRDAATGEPTGLLKDAAMHLVQRVLPPPSLKERLAAARAATDHAASLGVTSVHDVLANDDVEVYLKLARRGELKTRIYAARTIRQWRRAAQWVRKAGGRRAHAPLSLAGGWVRVGAVKGFADGSLGSSTALFFEDYLGQPGNRGLLFDEMLPEGTMLKRVLGADRAGLPVMIHAIGDQANWRILELYAEVARRHRPRDRRFRIEHAQHLLAAEIPRFAAQEVIASVQPYHAIDDGCWCEPRLGPARLPGTYAFRALLDAGATLALGTDWTVAPLNPLLTLYAAVTRRTLDGRHPRGWLPEQKLTLEEAVRAYTLGSARAEFAEHDKGALAPGKLADLVMLNEDIFRMPAAEVPQARVVLTVVDGRVVFGGEE